MEHTENLTITQRLKLTIAASTTNVYSDVREGNTSNKEESKKESVRFDNSTVEPLYESFIQPKVEPVDVHHADSSVINTKELVFQGRHRSASSFNHEDDKYSAHAPTYLYPSSSLSNELPHQEATYSLEFRLKCISQLAYMNSFASKMLEIETILADNLMKLDYGPKVANVYNPVDYAYRPHLEYYKKFCHQTTEILFVGMNPGPFGMAQSGVPFGDIASVSEWLGIREPVGSPAKLNPKRPILGFDLKRIEVSGSRLWSFLKEKFGTPDNFFSRCFIYNHCPLVFMGPSGKNITPAQMPASVRHQLNYLCDEAMVESISIFSRCSTLVGIGRFAEERIKTICDKYSLSHKQAYLMHPSPRNPTANKEWLLHATKALNELGIMTNSDPTSGDPHYDEPAVDKTVIKRQLF